MGKLHLRKSKEATLIVALCFSVMMLLGTPLHHHDLDHLQIDPDCAPFHLFESSINFESNAPDLLPLTNITYGFSLPDSIFYSWESVPASSRAPPAFV